MYAQYLAERKAVTFENIECEGLLEIRRNMVKLVSIREVLF